jgi:hypothetical protein
VVPGGALRTAATRAAEVSPVPASAAETSASDMRAVVAKSRSGGGTRPAGFGNRSSVAYAATAQRSADDSRLSNAGIAVPTTPMLTRR